MSSSPLVSVIIATRNRSTTLRRAIDSVLSQRYEPLELIIVDDASTDNTADVLRDYKGITATGKVILIIVNDERCGLAVSLNRAISISRGEYIARLDDDDVWIDEDKLKKQMAFLDANKEFALLGSGYIDDDCNITVNPLTDQAIRNQILFRCPICHSTVIIRKSALVRNGAYDETLVYAEDWELWLRMGRNHKLGNIPDITVQKAFHAQTLSSQFFVDQFSIIKKILKPHQAFYKYGILSSCYHSAVQWFFVLIPTYSLPHRIAQRAYSLVFLRTEKGKRREGKSFLVLN
jgi:glycosyltransferase involved in cell wall biosynthesis